MNNKYNMVEKKLIQVGVNAGHNYCHLIEFMKREEYLKDKVKRLTDAWKVLDARRVQEYESLQDLTPFRARKKPCTESFHLPPTNLNLPACSTEHLP